MKTFRNYIVLALAAIASLTMTACDPDHYDNAAWHMWKITVEGEGVAYKEVTISVGATLQLGLQIVPSFVNVVDPVWLSEDETVATIDKKTGLVTALKTGVTTINVYSEYNPEIYDHITLRVSGGSITIDEDDAVDQSEAEARRR